MAASAGDVLWHLGSRGLSDSRGARGAAVGAQCKGTGLSVCLSVYGILAAGDFLTAEEHAVLRWGRNAKSTGLSA
jgi:hypothetical protein